RGTEAARGASRVGEVRSGVAVGDGSGRGEGERCERPATGEPSNSGRDRAAPIPGGARGGRPGVTARRTERPARTGEVADTAGSHAHRPRDGQSRPAVALRPSKPPLDGPR